MKGRYIVFEGIVGSGKSTQAKRLFGFLKKEFPEKEIILTREPGGDEIAESVRKIVQGTEFTKIMEPICEAYLYASARAQTLRSVIKPVLERDGIVISDRSFLSSVAYQGYARELGADKILEINKTAVDNITPHIVLFINIDPAIGLKRSFDRKGDKFEKEDVEFFKKVEKGYKELSKTVEKWINIDGSGSMDDVFNRISRKVMETLR